MEQPVEETSPVNGATTPLNEHVDPIAQKHRDAVRREKGNSVISDASGSNTVDIGRVHRRVAQDLSRPPK